MAHIYRLDNWIPENPTDEDFKSQFSETWDYPDRKKRKKEIMKKHYQENREVYLARARKQRMKKGIELSVFKRFWKLVEGRSNKTYPKTRTSAMKKRLKRKIAIIDHYSDHRNECACCKDKNLYSLTIDHIKGGNGNSQRRQLAGNPFYKWLISNNFPTGYQVLCWACNNSKHIFERCRLDHSQDSSYWNDLY